MSKVQILRMTSGEEIISDLVVSADIYIMKNPMVIIPTGDGNIGVSRWLPYADAQAVTVSKKFVVFVVDPVKDLVDNYNRLNSKLILPEIKEIILG